MVWEAPMDIQLTVGRLRELLTGVAATPPVDDQKNEDVATRKPESLSLTAGELRELLATVDDDTPIVLATDSAGSHFYPLEVAESDKAYVSEEDGDEGIVWVVALWPTD